MFVPFDQLPPEARIWIYQANRPLTADELARVDPSLAQFAEAWTSHGRQLRASATFLHRQFLIVGLDEAEAGASGCSIDASVRFVRELEAALDLTLLEKSQLAFLVGDEVRLFDRRQLRAAVTAGQLHPATPYFDTTVAQRRQLAAPAWPAPAAATWLARYFAEA